MAIRSVFLFTFALLVSFAFRSGASAQQVAADARPPLERHLAHLLTGSGQWRTPNEDYDPEDPNGMSHYGADYRMSGDGSHAIAEITGVTPDGRRAVFWTIYFFYNPVTEEVVSAQIGWNGTYMEGRQRVHEAALTTGGREVFDQLMFARDGTVRITRHELVSTGPDTHTTQTYDRGEGGAWEPRNFRVWTLVPEE